MNSFTPEETAQKEFYKYSYKELVEEKGSEGEATQIVNNYIKLSNQFAACESWCVHDSKLLTSFRNPDADLEPSRFLLDKVCSVFYAPITNKTNRKDLSIGKIAELIKGDKFYSITKELRSISDPKANREFKQKKFSYATFSGTFSYCADINLTQHSGLICIDVDHIGDKLPEVQQIINNDPPTVMSFASPNGDGLKVLYAMEPGKYTQAQYYQAYSNYICKITGLEPEKVDQSGKNVSRACFLPCDPSIYVNPYFAAI